MYIIDKTLKYVFILYTHACTHTETYTISPGIKNEPEVTIFLQTTSCHREPDTIFILYMAFSVHKTLCYKDCMPDLTEPSQQLSEGGTIIIPIRPIKTPMT